MYDQSMEQAIDQIPIYGSNNHQIGVVGDIINREHHDQVVNDVKRAYHEQSVDETESQ